MSKIWKPVEDGDLHSFLAVQDNGETVAVFVNDDYGYAEESLPDDLRLCRLVPDEGSVPVEVIETVVRWSELLHALVMDLRAHNVVAANVLRKEIDAMLTWVQQQKGGNDE